MILSKRPDIERFISRPDAAIRAVNDKEDPVVFVLWGAYAQKKGKHIDTGRHLVLTGAHPSAVRAVAYCDSSSQTVSASSPPAGPRRLIWSRSSATLDP